MPQNVGAADQTHAPAPVLRRLINWSILSRWRGIAGAIAAPCLQSALRLAVRASQRPRLRKSQKAVTGGILAKLPKACAGDRPVDVRDRALLLMSFASGCRRRWEVAALGFEDARQDDAVRAVDMIPHSLSYPP
jgi:integrase